MVPQVLYAETVHPPRWYYIAWASLVGALLGGLAISETGWSPPGPLFIAYIAASVCCGAVVISPLWPNRAGLFPILPLRISVTPDRLAFGYYPEHWAARFGRFDWAVNHRSAGRVSLRIDELRACRAERSLRAVFLPRGNWLAVFWGFQVPYLATGIYVHTTGRGRYWVSSRHPEQVRDAIERARRTRDADIEMAG